MAALAEIQKYSPRQGGQQLSVAVKPTPNTATARRLQSERWFQEMETLHIGSFPDLGIPSVKSDVGGVSLFLALYLIPKFVQPVFIFYRFLQEVVPRSILIQLSSVPTSLCFLARTPLLPVSFHRKIMRLAMLAEASAISCCIKI